MLFVLSLIAFKERLAAGYYTLFWYLSYIPCSALCWIYVTFLLPLSALLLVHTKLGFGLFPQHCLRARTERGVCVLWVLYQAAGSRITVPASLYVQCVLLLEKTALARRRWLHRTVLPSTWQQSANLISVSSEQEFHVYWQLVKGCWEVVCSCRAPSLYSIIGWPTQSHIDLYQGSSLSQLCGLPLLRKLRPIWTWAVSVNASKHFWETRWIVLQMASFHPSCTALQLEVGLLLGIYCRITITDGELQADFE